MKKLLLLGALLSTVAMAQVVEVRIGGDLSNSGKFKGGFSDGADLEKKAIKKFDNLKKLIQLRIS